MGGEGVPRFRARREPAQPKAKQRLEYVPPGALAEERYKEYFEEGKYQMYAPERKKEELKYEIADDAEEVMGTKIFTAMKEAAEADPENKGIKAALAVGMTYVPTLLEKTTKKIVDRSYNITPYASVSRSGKKYRTIKIPKAMIVPAKPKKNPSPAMFFTVLSMFIWRIFARASGVRPPSLFIRACINFFRAEAGVTDETKKITTEDLQTFVGNMIQDGMGGVFVAYLADKALRLIYKKQLDEYMKAKKEMLTSEMAGITQSFGDPTKIKTLLTKVLGVLSGFKAEGIDPKNVLEGKKFTEPKGLRSINKYEIKA